MGASKGSSSRPYARPSTVTFAGAPGTCTRSTRLRVPSAFGFVRSTGVGAIARRLDRARVLEVDVDEQQVDPVARREARDVAHRGLDLLERHALAETASGDLLAAGAARRRNRVLAQALQGAEGVRVAE